jgi:hypothetical protein
MNIELERNELEEAISRLDESFAADTRKAKQRYKDTDTQFDKRNYIRALFAQLEGSTYYWKDMALKIQKSNPSFLSPAEYALTREMQYNLQDNGKPREYKRLLRSKENILFGLRLLAKIVDVKLEFDTKSDGWKCFLDAFKIRNRITHPKSNAEGLVSDEDFDTVERCESWYQSQINYITETVISRVDSFTSRFNIKE